MSFQAASSRSSLFTSGTAIAAARAAHAARSAWGPSYSTSRTPPAPASPPRTATTRERQSRRADSTENGGGTSAAGAPSQEGSSAMLRTRGSSGERRSGPPSRESCSRAAPGTLRSSPAFPSVFTSPRCTSPESSRCREPISYSRRKLRAICPGRSPGRGRTLRSSMDTPAQHDVFSRVSSRYRNMASSLPSSFLRTAGGTSAM